MKKRIYGFLVVALAVAVPFALAGCAPKEKSLKDEIKDVGHEAGEAAEKAADEAKEALDEAADDVGDAVDEAVDDVEDAADDAKDDVDEAVH